MTPNTLEEFIERAMDDVAIDAYCDENRSLSDELERNQWEIDEAKDIMKRFAPKLAAEILRVCEEWLFADDVDWPGFDIEKNRVTRMQICVASELYDFLKSYITSTNTKGGE